MNINEWEAVDFPHFFYKGENQMFKLDGNMKFISIDPNYIKALNAVCSEVYYKSTGYENKPYIGILVSTDNRSYVIPLSSECSQKMLRDLMILLLYGPPRFCSHPLTVNSQDEHLAPEKEGRHSRLIIRVCHFRYS